MKELIQAKIDALTQELKEEKNPNRYAILWDERVELKQQLSQLDRFDASVT